MTVTCHGQVCQQEETRLYQIASTVAAQAMQSTQQANGMFAKQMAGLIQLASILGAVSESLATNALCVLAC